MNHEESKETLVHYLGFKAPHPESAQVCITLERAYFHVHVECDIVAAKDAREKIETNLFVSLCDSERLDATISLVEGEFENILFHIRNARELLPDQLSYG